MWSVSGRCPFHHPPDMDCIQCICPVQSGSSPFLPAALTTGSRVRPLLKLECKAWLAPTGKVGPDMAEKGLPTVQRRTLWFQCRYSLLTALLYGSPAPVGAWLGWLEHSNREDTGKSHVWLAAVLRMGCECRGEGCDVAWAAVGALLSEHREGQSCCPAGRGWLQDCTFPRPFLPILLLQLFFSSFMCAVAFCTSASTPAPLCSLCPAFLHLSLLLPGAACPSSQPCFCCVPPSCCFAFLV